MVAINEGSKVKLHDGRMGIVCEVLEEDTAYMIETFDENDEDVVDPVLRSDIDVVFVETAYKLA